jgi:adenylate cyclase
MPYRAVFAHPFHPALRAGRTQRLPVVEVTLLFADVVAPTELTRRVGDRRAYSLMRRFCRLARDTAQRRGGEALELRGDGALLAFAAPLTALVCAREIQLACAREGELNLRMGLHAGRALRLERGYFGETLIVAGRLADHADAGEILVSAQLVAKLEAPPALPLGAARPLLLKGFPEPVEAYRLEWRAKEAFPAYPPPRHAAAPAAVASA